MTDSSATGARLPGPAAPVPAAGGRSASAASAPFPTDEPVIRVIAMPSDTNPEGDIFGGWLVSQMDLAGSTTAFRLAKGRCATVAVDGMSFLSPVFVGDEVSLFCQGHPHWAHLDHHRHPGLAPPPRQRGGRTGHTGQLHLRGHRRVIDGLAR